jgi:hypothetical protein
MGCNSSTSADNSTIRNSANCNIEKVSEIMKNTLGESLEKDKDGYFFELDGTNDKYFKMIQEFNKQNICLPDCDVFTINQLDKFDADEINKFLLN